MEKAIVKVRKRFSELTDQLNLLKRKTSSSEASVLMGKLSDVAIDYHLIYLQKFYSETKNALFAWEGILLSRTKQNVPSWVLEYFINSGENLLQIDTVEDHASPLVYKALQMKQGGQRSVFLRYQDFKRQIKGCRQVLKMKLKDPSLKYDEIFIDIGEKMNTSETTVKSWYQKHKEFLEPIVELEVKQGIQIDVSINGTVSILMNPPA